jgi:hypothetical protein
VLFFLADADSHGIRIAILNVSQIQRRIAQVQKQLLELGPLHSGSISEQYNVCGTPGCRCKDPKNPHKHGPYYQLSYTWQGKSSTRFLRPEQVEEMHQKVANYKRTEGTTRKVGGYCFQVRLVEGVIGFDAKLKTYSLCDFGVFVQTQVDFRKAPVSEPVIFKYCIPLERNGIENPPDGRDGCVITPCWRAMLTPCA